MILPLELAGSGPGVILDEGFSGESNPKSRSQPGSPIAANLDCCFPVFSTLVGPASEIKWNRAAGVVGAWLLQTRLAPLLTMVRHLFKGDVVGSPVAAYAVD
jgi:hypothetical protein